MVKCTESIIVLAKALFLESAGMLRFVLDGMDDG